MATKGIGQRKVVFSTLDELQAKLAFEAIMKIGSPVPISRDHRQTANANQDLIYELCVFVTANALTIRYLRGWFNGWRYATYGE